MTRVKEIPQQSLSTETQEQNVRLSKLCCFCIPSKVGLIVLGLLKLVINLGLLIIIILTFILFMLFSLPELLYPIIILICTAILIDLLDLFIGLVIIVSVCTKDHISMEIYYKFSIYIFGSLTFICCLISYFAGKYFFLREYILSTHIIAMTIIFCILFSILMMQVYLNQMVKNEVKKMKRNEVFTP